MKTIQRILQTTCLAVIGIMLFSNAQAQMSPYKFNQLFNQAFSNVVTAEYQQAIPLLESLHKADKEHAQVAFLLGMSYLKTEQETEQTIGLLKNAASRFSAYHQLGNVEDRTAPSKVWLLLAEAYKNAESYREAELAYRNYMTVIPLASLQQKRILIKKIERLKVIQNNGKQAFVGSNSTNSLSAKP